MKDDEYTTNLLRMVAAELYFLCRLQTSQSLLGKGYFSLGTDERQIVDRTVFEHTGGTYSNITPNFLKTVAPSTAGFQTPSAPAAPTPAQSSKPPPEE